MIEWWEYLQTFEWTRLFPELLGKMLGVITGFAVSWFVLVRRRLKALERVQAGDSDDFIFQAHFLLPAPAQLGNRQEKTVLKESKPGKFVLVFRNMAPKTTLNDLYDNIAVRDVVKQLADQCTMVDPVLQTKGTLGFELLNDALGHIAGIFAISPTARQTWLFMMTCEDRQIVRKKCVRCFLIRPHDLKRFADWQWCVQSLQVERPWHWFRIVALHQIAQQYTEQQCQYTEQQRRAAATDIADERMPLVNSQDHHDRIRPVSLGIAENEILVETPVTVDWSSHLTELAKMGLNLEHAASNTK